MADSGQEHALYEADTEHDSDETPKANEPSPPPPDPFSVRVEINLVFRLQATSLNLVRVPLTSRMWSTVGETSDLVLLSTTLLQILPRIAIFKYSLRFPHDIQAVAVADMTTTPPGVVLSDNVAVNLWRRPRIWDPDGIVEHQQTDWQGYMYMAPAINVEIDSRKVIENLSQGELEDLRARQMISGRITRPMLR